MYSLRHYVLEFSLEDLANFIMRVSICVLQDRAPGEPFVAKSSKEAEMEKLLKSMEVFYFLVSFLFYSTFY